MALFMAVRRVTLYWWLFFFFLLLKRWNICQIFLPHTAAARMARCSWTGHRFWLILWEASQARKEGGWWWVVTIGFYTPIKHFWLISASLSRQGHKVGRPSAEVRQLNEAAGFPWPTSPHSSHTQMAASETNMDSELRVNKYRLARWTRSKLAVGIWSIFSPYPQWWRSLSGARQTRRFRKETRYIFFLELDKRKENNGEQQMWLYPRKNLCCKAQMPQTSMYLSAIIYAKNVTLGRILGPNKCLRVTWYARCNISWILQIYLYIHLEKSLKRAKREGQNLDQSVLVLLV